MIHIIYMAAGNSRRFGNENKLLQNWKGKPLYLHTFEKLLRIREKEPEKISLTVVTQYPEICREVQNQPGVNAVFCKESRLGVSYTIKAGIRAVGEIYDSVKKKICLVQEAHDFVRKEHCFVKNESSFERKTEHVRTWDYLMFTVADQPNLSEQSIEALIGAAGQRFRQGYTSQPPTFSLCCGERVGNPCMFRADLIPELMQLEGDKGGRSVLKKHECCYVEIENKEEFSDIDTEEQMKKMSGREKTSAKGKKGENA
ncbi:MAG: nucleotidyltransferase family protein [Lachnospiraceae bacterium]